MGLEEGGRRSTVSSFLFSTSICCCCILSLRLDCHYWLRLYTLSWESVSCCCSDWHFL